MKLKNYETFLNGVKLISIGILLLGLGITIITLNMGASEDVLTTYNLFGAEITFEDQEDIGFLIFLLLYFKWAIAAGVCYILLFLASAVIFKNVKEDDLPPSAIPHEGYFSKNRSNIDNNTSTCYCPVCQEKNPSSRKHCSSCGAKLQTK